MNDIIMTTVLSITITAFLVIIVVQFAGLWNDKDYFKLLRDTIF